MYGWGYGAGGPPPPINVYPPIYPTAPPGFPPPPPPSKADIKEYMAFARAWSNRKDPKNKKEDPKKDERVRFHKRNFNLVEVIFFLIILGPIVGPVFNHIQEFVLKLINAH